MVTLAVCCFFCFCHVSVKEPWPADFSCQPIRISLPACLKSGLLSQKVTVSRHPLSSLHCSCAFALCCSCLDERPAACTPIFYALLDQSANLIVTFLHFFRVWHTFVCFHPVIAPGVHETETVHQKKDPPRWRACRGLWTHSLGLIDPFEIARNLTDKGFLFGERLCPRRPYLGRPIGQGA